MFRYLQLILILTSVALQACGKKEPTLELGEFGEYVTMFEERSAELGTQVKVTDLIIEMGDLPNPRERGACEIIGDQTPRIIISAKRWEKLDETSRRQLLFHELGHCVLFREHRHGKSEVGIPVSLMNPYAIDSYTYAEFEDYYTEELFHGD